MASQFTGDYGLTPNEANDYAVIGLITQMKGDLFAHNQALEAIAVWLVNRYGVTNLQHLQFLWTPDSQECGGVDEAYGCTYTPGYFRAVNLDNGAQIPQQFAQYDDGQATYYLGFKPDAKGKPTFGLVYANHRTHGVLKEVALALLAITSMVFDWSGTLGAAILGAGDAIAGAALAGEIGLQVGLTGTQVAQIVGSTAAGAVTSGGDPIKAIENAAAAYVGAQAGNFVAGAVDSAAAAKIATAAVTAAAKGQDVGRAILTSGATAAAGAITSGSTVDETNILFPSESTQGVDDMSVGYDWQLDPGDVLVDPFVDLGITGEIVVDDTALAAAGVSANAQIPDETGTLFNVAGQFTSTPLEVYAGELYATVGPNGGVEILGPDNNVVLSETDVANTTSDADLQTKLLQGLSARAGSTQPSGAAPTDRPANLTAPADKTSVGSVLDISKVAESVTKSLANIITVIKQVENGTYRPGVTTGAINPYGTLRPQIPGQRVTNADGSTSINNGNGTITTTYPNGQQVTTKASMSTAGAFGGVSTNTLLLVGAGLAAALLLRRK